MELLFAAQVFRRAFPGPFAAGWCAATAMILIPYLPMCLFPLCAFCGEEGACAWVSPTACLTMVESMCDPSRSVQGLLTTCIMACPQPFNNNLESLVLCHCACLECFGSGGPFFSPFEVWVLVMCHPLGTMRWTIEEALLGVTGQSNA